MKCYWVNVYKSNGRIRYGGLWPSEAEARNAPRSIEPMYRLRVMFKRRIYLPKLYDPYYYIRNDDVFERNAPDNG